LAFPIIIFQNGPSFFKIPNSKKVFKGLGNFPWKNLPLGMGNSGLNSSQFNPKFLEQRPSNPKKEPLIQNKNFIPFNKEPKLLPKKAKVLRGFLAQPFNFPEGNLKNFGSHFPPMGRSPNQFFKE